LNKWIIRHHPHFYKDLEKLGTNELRTFQKKLQKIKDNPERQKHLSGGKNCYREPITDNIRLVYMIKEDIIWLLSIARHEKAYKSYLKRFYTVREKLVKYGIFKTNS
jgi:mRNA-degrading endonuclease RelE of RelBE toxin-antitoxin system